MSFDFVLTDEHREKTVKKHSEEVAESLEEKVERRQSELDMCGSVPVQRLDRRLQRTIGHNGQHFAEVRFQAHNRPYRALFVVLEDREKLVYLTVVGKEDRFNSSRQKELIFSLFDRVYEARRYAEKQLNLINESE